MMDKSSPEYRTVFTSVPSPFIHDVRLDGGTLTVELRDDLDFDDYWNSGDKVNKILSIEVARWFVKLPNINVIDATVDMGNGDVTRVVASREDAEDFYDMPLNDEATGIRWNDLLEAFDTSSHRERFVTAYGVVEEEEGEE